MNIGIFEIACHWPVIRNFWILKSLFLLGDWKFTIYSRIDTLTHLPPPFLSIENPYLVIYENYLSGHYDNVKRIRNPLFRILDENLSMD